jgi:redox-sensing transcriptional repressor
MSTRRGPPAARISEPTVRRLSHYYRVLLEVEAEGKRLISSHRLAEREGITSAQVRKDLSMFGSFGRRGLGYQVRHLREEIRTILGLDRRWKVALIGAGNVGAALVLYPGFSAQGFDIVAAFDRDPSRIGQRLGPLTVQDVSEFRAAATREAFDLAVITTPVRAAQDAADLAVAGGVRGILNFAPRKLSVPEHIALRSVDMSVEFETLSFEITRERNPRRRRAPG